MDDKIIPINEANQNRLTTPPERGFASPLKISQDAKGMMRLAELLMDMFKVMNIFGREPGSLKVIIPLFQNDLGEYPIEAVELAFASWRQDSSAFPTPFDILNILRFDPDESVPDPNDYPGWYVKRGSLKPGDAGYIKPPARHLEISAVMKNFAPRVPLIARKRDGDA
ncbi:MAG: hypothetical protein Dbin4_02941 [Alphaproteobacteria bacterium]|nr:hypothetical protein [Alphaproteobacteria bacterium]